ncbi:3'-5' exonuclease [uncultured Corynebacterium sp.]|uniref:3'-5' exonuclease n=1 Tax=uncultured Corynebacterium sp. TaxID=159447 RepID=UPI0025E01BA3|nr:3'-5' exonuclease [uncultured Corynebacterium sp.]
MLVPCQTLLSETQTAPPWPSPIWLWLTWRLSTGRRTSRERPVAVMTMHNAKGLEFTHVVLLDVSREALPQRYLMKGLAPAEDDEALQRERALLYVAASHARDVLVVSVVGEASELLPV